MFIKKLNNGSGIAKVATLLAFFGCNTPENSQKAGEPQVEATNYRLVTATRHMPFLPGQRAGISQGNNGATSHYGTLQYGVDFTVNSPTGHMSRGMPVVATNDGYVSEASSGNKDTPSSCGRGWGNTVAYCSGYRTGTCERAGHLREVFVKVGDFVRQGQVIGLIGNSGESDGAHLHDQVQGSAPCDSAIDPHEQAVCGASIPNDYVFKATKAGPDLNDRFEQSLWGGHYSSNYTNPITISLNENLMGQKYAQYTITQIGFPTTPRDESLMGLNEGWGGYGWHTEYVVCIDDDKDSDTTCANEGVYRNNAYIQRFSGGSFGNSVIVYDALSGATNPYLIHSGFLTDPENGWDSRGNYSSVNGVDIGMPISDEYQTSYGARQDFQWGWLKWDASNSLVTARRYGTEISFKRSVGPGVFAPSSSVDEYHWNRQISYRFVDAWNLQGGFSGMGEPYSDNGAGAGVHDWSGTRFMVQNFTSSTHGDSVLMYDPENSQYANLMGAYNIPVEVGWNKAYAIRSWFWNWYRNNNGISLLKAPINDEYVIPSGKRQDFLCGHMEYNTSTQAIVAYPDSALPACNLIVMPGPGTNCYVQGKTSTNNNGTGGGFSYRTIDCRVGPTDMTVFVTGPVQDGLFSTMYQDGAFIEYGSDTDGWAPYTSGKPKNTWVGDWITAEVPRTYMFTLGSNVQNMNFFMYDPTTSAVSWFDLDKWTITGDCWRDGGGIRHSVPPTATKTLACAVNGANMTVTFTGPMGEGVFGNPPADYPTYLEYGSSTDGWAPYTTGKPIQTFASWSNSHTMLMSSNVQNMNFFLYGPFSGQVNWFDLDKWTITGACWRDGGGIRHSMPPTMPKYIDCQVAGPDMTVTVTGPIDQGIFGLPPTDNPTYIEYGSDSDGWGPYTTGKPKATWFNWLNAHTFIMSASVQNMNFFMYGPLSGQVSWFDLNQWTITGRCWRDGGGIRHN